MPEVERVVIENGFQINFIGKRRFKSIPDS